MSQIFEDSISEMDWNDDPFSADNREQDAGLQTESWKGVPMNDIYCGSNPWTAPEPSPIAPAYNHAVLFHIPQSGIPRNRPEPPIPQRGSDHWDKDHVRLPHSLQSLYPVKNSDGTTELKQRWYLIRSALLEPIRNCKELENAILSYNTKHSKNWKFFALYTLFNEHLEEEECDHFFSITLPKMVKLALSLPELIQAPIPLLRQHRNRSISLSQQQIACLLANAFFCTFPRRNTNKSNSEYNLYPCINFFRLFQCRKGSASEKLKCLFHYFRRVCSTMPCGVLTFTRRSIEVEKCPDWSNQHDPIGRTPLCINAQGTIEDDGIGLLQLDFANKYLGGGVLGYGCVQEEIRFVICPELLVSMLFTECLRPTEALIMIGSERFSQYSGYADTFMWTGNYEESTPYDSSGRRKCVLVAIDALQFNVSANQYKPEFIRRELNKAWVGFSTVLNNQPQSGLHILPGVATGNWGCGAFGGSPYLKSLLQIMACTAAKKPIAYFTFGDTDLRDALCDIYNFIAQNNITIGQLFQCLINYHKFSNTNDKLYPFILQYYNDKLSQGKVMQALQSSSKKKVVTALSDHNNSEIPENGDTPESAANNKEEFQTITDDSFVDIEKGYSKENQDNILSNCNEPKPSTSFFDEFCKLEEIKVKYNAKKCLNSNMTDHTLPETVNEVTNIRPKAKTVLKSSEKDDKEFSPKRVPKKISDYFVPVKK